METCFLKHSFKKTYQCFSENNIYIYIYISEIQSSFAEAFKLNTDLRSNGSVSINNYTKLIFKPLSFREFINGSNKLSPCPEISPVKFRATYIQTVSQWF